MDNKKKTDIKKRNIGNQAKWFQNVAKSFGFATSDIITELMPSTAGLFSQGKDLATDARDFIRENKANNKKLSDMLNMESFKGPLDDVKTLMKNIKADLKSGQLNASAKGQSPFGDMDLGGDFDFSFGDESDFSFDSSDFSFDSDSSSDFSSDSSSEPNVIVPSVNISSNISKNNPMVEALNMQSSTIVETTQAQMQHNATISVNNMMMIQKSTEALSSNLSTINENLTLLLKFQEDSMSKYITSSLKFYEDNLKVLTDTLEFMKNPPEKEDDFDYNGSSNERISATDLLYGDGGFDIKKYFSYIKQQGKSAVDNNFILSSLKMVAGNKDMKGMMLNNPLASIPTMIIKSFMPSALQSVMKSFDETLNNFIPSMIMSLTSKFEDGPLSFISDIFGLKESVADSDINVGEYEKGEIPFDGITKKAITEVIPGYLRQILSALTGREETAFDYDSGTFKKVSDMKKEHEEKYKSNILNQYGSLYDIKDRLNAFEFSNREQMDEFKKKIDDAFVAFTKYSGFINPEGKDDGFGGIENQLESIYNFGSKEENDLFKELILSLSKSDIMKTFSRDRLSAQKASKTFVENEEKNITSSANVLFNKLVDFDSKGKVVQPYKNNDIFNKKDTFGKTSLDYLRDIRSILTEGIRVYVAKGQGTFLSKRISDLHDERELNVSKRIKKESVSSLLTNEDRERALLSGKTALNNFSELGDSSSIKEALQRKIKFDKDEEESRKKGGMLASIKELFVVEDGDNKDKKKKTTIFDSFKKLTEMPGNIVKNLLEKADAFMYKAVFGIHQKRENGEKESIFNVAMNKITSTFNKFFNWVQKDVYEPIKESLFGKEGFFTKIKESDWWKKLSDKGRGFRDWILGKEDSDGNRKGGLLSSVFNEVKDGFAFVSHSFTGNAYVDSKGNKISKNENSIFGHMNKSFKSFGKTMKEYFFGSKKDPNKEGEQGILSNIGSSLKMGFQNFSDAIFGPKKVKGKKNDNHIAIDELTSKLKERAPKALAGGIFGAGAGLLLGGNLGLLGSLFLPGGPIGGAVLGISVSLLSQSERFKKFLFGEKDDNGERMGGFISKKTQEFFKKHKAALVGGTAIGAVKGFLGFGLLPSFILGGPITGALFGLGTAMITKSEWFKSMLFGKADESGERVGGIFSKLNNKFNQDPKFKKKMGTIGAGILGGAGIGAVLSSFGILGGLMFGPVSGAVFGAATAIGMTSDKWKEMLFGKVDEETQIRKGGILNKLINKVHLDMLEPLKIQALEWGNNVRFWFEEKIGGRILDALYPIKEEFIRLKGRIVESFVNIGKWFNQSSVKKNLFDPIIDGFSKLLDPIKDAAKFMVEKVSFVFGKMISAPFKLLQKVGNSLFNKHMKEGIKAVRKQIIENLKNSPIGKFLSKNIITPIKEATSFVMTGAKKLFSTITKGTFKFLGLLGKGMLKITGQVFAAPFKVLAAPFKLMGSAINMFKRMRGKEDGVVRNQSRLDDIKSGNRTTWQSIKDFGAITFGFGSKLRHDAKFSEGGAHYAPEMLSKREERRIKLEENKRKAAESIQAKKDALSAKRSLINKLNETSGVAGDAISIKQMEKLLKSEYGKGWAKLSQHEQNAFMKAKLDSITAEETRKNTQSISEHTKDTVSAVDKLTDTMKSLFTKGWATIKEENSVLDIDPESSDVDLSLPDNKGKKKSVLQKTKDTIGVIKDSVTDAVDKTIDKVTTKMEPIMEKVSNAMQSVTGNMMGPIPAPAGGINLNAGGLSNKATQSMGLEETMARALEKEDARDDKEEAAKEKLKEEQIKNEEKFKHVSRKNVQFQMEQAKIKSDEAEKKTFMTKVVDLLGMGNKDRAQAKDNWAEIFSKKGLITSLLLFGLPFLTDMIGKWLRNFNLNSITEAIKNGFNWMNNNENRRDPDGTPIENADFNEALTVGGIKVGAQVGKYAMKHGGKLLTKMKGGWEATKALGKKVGKFFGIGGKVGKEVGEEVLEKGAKKGLGKAISKAGSKVANVVDDATKGLLSKFTKLVNEVAIPKITGLFSKVAKGKLSKVGKSISSMTQKLLKPQFLAKKTPQIVNGMTKTAGSAATIGILDAIFVTWGAVTGAMEAGRLFGVSPDRVDWLMRAIAGAIKGIMNISFMFVIDILNDISVEVFQVDYLRMLATTVYQVLTSEAQTQKLTDAQNDYKAEWQAYNEEQKALNPEYNGISFDAYIDKNQKTVGQKIGKFFVGEKDAEGNRISNGLFGGAIDGFKNMFGFGKKKGYQPGMGGATAEEAMLGDNPAFMQGIGFQYNKQLNPKIQKAVEKVIKSYDKITQDRLSDLVSIITMPEFSGAETIFDDNVKNYIKENLKTSLVNQISLVWNTANELSTRAVYSALGINSDKDLKTTTVSTGIGAALGTILGGPIGTAIGAGVGFVVGKGISWISKEFDTIDKQKPILETVNRIMESNRSIFNKTLESTLVIADGLTPEGIFTPEMNNQLTDMTKASVTTALSTVWKVSNEMATEEWSRILGISDKFSLSNMISKFVNVLKPFELTAMMAVNKLVKSTQDLYNKALDYTIGIITERPIEELVTEDQLVTVFNMTKENVGTSLITVWEASNKLATKEWNRVLGLETGFNLWDISKVILDTLKPFEPAAVQYMDKLNMSTLKLYNKALDNTIDLVEGLPIDILVDDETKFTLVGMTKDNIKSSLITVWEASNKLATKEWNRVLGLETGFNLFDLSKLLLETLKPFEHSAIESMDKLNKETTLLYTKSLDYSLDFIKDLPIENLVTDETKNILVNMTKENVSSALQTVWQASNEYASNEWKKVLGVSDKFNLYDLLTKVSNALSLNVNMTAHKAMETLTKSTMELYNRELDSAVNWFNNIDVNNIFPDSEKNVLLDLTKENLKNALGTAWGVSGELAVREWNKALGIDPSFNFWNTVANVGKGAAAGAAMGMVGGPIGAAIGGAIGGAVALFGEFFNKATSIDEKVKESIGMLIDRTADLYNQQLITSVGWFNEMEDSKLLLTDKEKSILVDLTKDNLKNALGSAWTVAGELTIQQWNKTLGLDKGYNFWKSAGEYSSSAWNGLLEGGLAGALKGIVDKFQERNSVKDKVEEAILKLIDKTEDIYNTGLIESVKWLDEYDAQTALPDVKQQLLPTIKDNIQNAIGNSWTVSSEITTKKWDNLLKKFKNSQTSVMSQTLAKGMDQLESEKKILDNFKNMQNQTTDRLIEILDTSKSILNDRELLPTDDTIQEITKNTKEALTENLTTAWDFNIETVTAKWKSSMKAITSKYSLGQSFLDSFDVPKNTQVSKDELTKETSLEMEELIKATNKLWAHRLKTMSNIVNNGSLGNISLIDGNNIIYKPINDGLKELDSYYNSIKEVNNGNINTYINFTQSKDSKFYGIKQMMFYSKRIFGLPPFLLNRLSSDTSKLYSKFSNEMGTGLSQGESMLKQTTDIVNSIKSNTNLSNVFSTSKDPKNLFASLTYNMSKAFLSPLMIMKKMIAHVVDIYKKQNYFDMPNFNITEKKEPKKLFGLGGATKEEALFDEEFNMDEEISPVKGAGMGGADELSMIDKYPVTSKYGMRGPIKGTTHKTTNMHYGIDLAMRGGNILSFTDGVVKQVKSDAKGYGKHVVVQDSNRHHHLYAHMSKMGVKEGQSVRRGQPLGVEGSTGNSSGPHLHYEVRTPENKYGKTLDPKGYLKAYKGSGTVYNGPNEVNDVSSIGKVQVDDGKNNQSGLSLLTSTLGDALNNFISPLNQVTSALSSAMGSYLGTGSKLESSFSSPKDGGGHEGMSAIAPKGAEDRIGYYIKEFESGNKGPSMISSGKGDYGGVSFGTYQFPTYGKSVVGDGENLHKFWSFAGYDKKYPGVKPGNNSDFKKAWAKEASADPQGFSDREYAFALQKYYTAGKSYMKNTLDPDKHSRAAQEMVWSTSVQYGPASDGKIFSKALAGVPTPQTMKTEDLINKIADYKYNTVDSWFKSSGKSMRDGLRLRHGTKERNKLLGIKDKPPVKYPGMGGASIEDVLSDENVSALVDRVSSETFNEDFGGMGGASLSDIKKDASIIRSNESFSIDSINQAKKLQDKNNDVVSKIIDVLTKIASNTSTTNTHLDSIKDLTKKNLDKPVQTQSQPTKVIQNNNHIGVNNTNNSTTSNSPMMDMVNKQRNEKLANNKSIAEKIARGF